MSQWLKERSVTTRILVYAAAALLAFGLAAGAGAMGAWIVGGDLALPRRQDPPPPDEEQKAPRQQEAAAPKQEEAAPKQEEAAPKQEGAAPEQEEAEYVATVGDVQAKAVETFLDTHNKLLRYDALTANDVEEMRANQAALEGFADQVDDLEPPQRYGAQYEAFRSAIDELRTATRLGYSMAADPVAAAERGFDEYDGHVAEAETLLQQSNELLGRNYKTIGDVQEISPEF